MPDTKEDTYKPTDLEDNGVYLFTEDVDGDSCSEAMRFILEQNLVTSGRHKHLTMIINSQGGNIVDGFALIDVMGGSKIPIHTVGLGLIASRGLLLFISGKKGKRTLTPNTLIMSHQLSSFFFGKEHELIAAQKEQKLFVFESQKK